MSSMVNMCMLSQGRNFRGMHVPHAGYAPGSSSHLDVPAYLAHPACVTSPGALYPDGPLVSDSRGTQRKVGLPCCYSEFLKEPVVRQQ